MKTLIGGAIAAALGLIGLGFWWRPFLQVLAGIIPAMLLLGGGLAIYLGLDELRDSWKEDEPTDDLDDGDGESEQYKKEIAELKEEIETLKQQ